ncbi:LuxR C-terminal-related transcriptional regulator [Streptomyces sp. NPDC097619]|uniref:helix-turn-helix transcriptional regulator n=1 Tax=Streptomyces sp. NPDC097619 TaxID=3157228 RepID=UPI003329E5DA
MLKDPLTPRAEELALLRRTLLLARESARFVRVTGEPWSGKTHLLRKLSDSAQGDGWKLAFGSVPRPGPFRPFDVLVDALDEHLGQADGSLFEELGPVHTRCLSSWFPSLATSTAADPPDAYGTVRALRTLIELLARDGGLLLVLDDTHRAGPETLDFLTHLVHHPPRAAVMTVFAHRTGTTARHLSAVAYDSGRVEHLPLGPLPPAEARTLLPPGLDPMAEAQALRDGAGVPGLLRILGQDGGGRLRAVPELTLGVPPLLHRGPVELHSLSSLGWRTACTAAVVGSPFTPGQVAAAAPLPEEEVRRGLDELHAEGLVDPDGSALRFRFTRPAVRSLLYHASGAGWRGAARQRAVTALRSDGTPSGRLALAAHLEDADPLTADDLRVLALAARDGLFLQPARSVRILRRVTRYPQSPVEARVLLLKALVVAGETEEALRGYAELWPRLYSVWAPGARDDALLWRVRALRLQGRPDQARELLDTLDLAPRPAGTLLGERAALLLEPDGDGPGPAAQQDWETVRTAVREDARRAVEDAGPAGEPAHAHAVARLAAVQAATGDLAESAVNARRCARLLDGFEDAELAADLEALRWLASAETALGDGDPTGHAGRGTELALRFGQAYLLGPSALELAAARAAGDDPDAATTAADLAAAAARRTGAVPLAAAAGRLRRRLSGRSAAEERRGHLSGLSSRELEIAALVGAGRTNQGIATRLDISVKTVETYMSRIFKKLGVNSRSQVAHAIGRSNGEY